MTIAPLATTGFSASGARGGGETAVRQFGRWEALCLFGLGVSLQLNVLLSNFGLPFQRLSDLVPFLLVPLLARRRAIRQACLEHAVRIGLVMLCLAASIVLKSEKAAGDVYLTLVLLLYFVQCLELVVLFRGAAGTAAFCWGVLAGFPGALAVLLTQSSGIDLAAFGLAVPTDLLDPEVVLFSQDKLGGLWNAGNETGHVFALTGAAALFLATHHRRTAIYVAYFAGLVMSFPLTNNRAGLIAPTIVLLILLRKSLDARSVLIGVGALAGLVMVFGATGELLLPESLQAAVERRFADDGAVEANADERIESTLGTVKLIVTNPFGLGVNAKLNLLKAEAGVAASHNGVLSLALQSGVCVALLFLLGAYRIVTRMDRFGTFAPSVVMFMLPSLLFEDLSVNQFVLFFMAFVLAHWALRDRADRSTSGG